MNDIIVRVTDLPCSVRGMTSPDANGDYNIYLNARLNFETQQKTYNHELKHIKMNHFESFKSVAECEREAS